jgi:hypothetical protein
MTTVRTTRRNSLRLVAALVGLAAAPPLAHIAGSSEPATRLASLFRDRRSAASVGARYLASYPEEASPERLLDLLVADRRLAAALAADDPVALRIAAASLVREDFLARHVARVDGWLLSRTEARLCGLAAQV